MTIDRTGAQTGVGTGVETGVEIGAGGDGDGAGMEIAAVTADVGGHGGREFRCRRWIRT
jgi:hypothetical protein